MGKTFSAIATVEFIVQVGGKIVWVRGEVEQWACVKKIMQKNFCSSSFSFEQNIAKFIALLMYKIYRVNIPMLAAILRRQASISSMEEGEVETEH